MTLKQQRFLTTQEHDEDVCLQVAGSYWTNILKLSGSSVGRPPQSLVNSDACETLFHYFEQLLEIVASTLLVEDASQRTRLLAFLEEKDVFNGYFTWLLRMVTATWSDDNQSSFSAVALQCRIREHMLSSLAPIAGTTSATANGSAPKLLGLVLRDDRLVAFLVSVLDFVLVKQPSSNHLLQKHPDGKSCSASEAAVIETNIQTTNKLLGEIVLSIASAFSVDPTLFLALYSNRCAFLPAYSSFRSSATSDLSAWSRGCSDAFPVISAMISVALLPNEPGQLGRQAIRILVGCAKRYADISLYLAEYTELCPVLATGLSGLYSALPSRLDKSNNERPENHPAGRLFAECFVFVNGVVSMAHEAIRDKLIDFLYVGFLVPVLVPALNQPLSEELVTAVIYLEKLCLRNLSSRHIQRTFVRLLLTASFDGVPVLQRLLSYLEPPASEIRANGLEARLLFATISVFRCFLSLPNEAIFNELIHRYLQPLTHQMPSQRVSTTALVFAKVATNCRLCPRDTMGSQATNGESLSKTFYGACNNFLNMVTLLPLSQRNNDGLARLEGDATGRRLLAEYTTLLEEAPSRLNDVQRLCHGWVRCGSYLMQRQRRRTLCIDHLNMIVVMATKTDAFLNEGELWKLLSPVIAELPSDSELLEEGRLERSETELDEVVALTGVVDSLGELTGKVRSSSTSSQSLSDFLVSNATPQTPGNNVTNGRQQQQQGKGGGQIKPSLGPFLARVIDLVDHFPTLPMSVCIALSDLVLHLASFPHLLTAQVIFDDKLIIHPDVRTLPIVLDAVREQLMANAQKDGDENLSTGLTRACTELFNVDSDVLLQETDISATVPSIPVTTVVAASPPIRRPAPSPLSSDDSKTMSPKAFFSRLLANPPQTPKVPDQATPHQKRIVSSAKLGLEQQPNRRESSGAELSKTSVVLARRILLFDEFCLELAAVANAQARFLADDEANGHAASNNNKVLLGEDTMQNQT